MTAREHINDYFNSKAFMVLSAVALVVTAALALAMGVAPVPGDNAGMFFSLKGTFFEPGPVSASVNVLCLLATGVIILTLNKVFTFVRSTTHLFASAFYWLQVANPEGLVSLNPGTLLCLVTVLGMLPLFASFQDRHSQRGIFLVFTLIAAGSMWHYGTMVLLPAFLLGFFYMGVLNLKGVLAMLFGLITPFWIAFGLGLVTPADFNAPHIHGIWNITWVWEGTLPIIVATQAAVLGIVLAAINVPVIMNYRMQPRVYNAFLVITLAIVVIAMCLDYTAVAVFLPLLTLMVSIQMAHAHTLHATWPLRYLIILMFVVACLASAASALTLVLLPL